MIWSLLADLIVVIHFLYVLFTVLGEGLILWGGFLKWQWIRNRTFRILHLAAVLLVALEALAGVLCPLTVWEYRLRGMAGQGAEQEVSFVARLIRRIIFYDFPEIFFIFLYTGFGILVIVTALLFPWKKKTAP
ncbi:MAG: DUF2784 domain-containing protein [Spirochaetales bacterium]|nr:DUF2784 domain-containing protein [Spirochaetales bacterium]